MTADAKAPRDRTPTAERATPVTRKAAMMAEVPTAGEKTDAPDAAEEGARAMAGTTTTAVTRKATMVAEVTTAGEKTHAPDAAAEGARAMAETATTAGMTTAEEPKATAEATTGAETATTAAAIRAMALSVEAGGNGNHARSERAGKKGTKSIRVIEARPISAQRAAVSDVRFAANAADQFGNRRRGKGIGQWSLCVGLDGVGIARMVAIFEKPAREHSLGGLLEPLIHQRGDFVPKVGGVIQAREFEALERGRGSLPKIFPRRIEWL